MNRLLDSAAQRPQQCVVIYSYCLSRHDLFWACSAWKVTVVQTVTKYALWHERMEICMKRGFFCFWMQYVLTLLSHCRWNSYYLGDRLIDFGPLTWNLKVCVGGTWGSNPFKQKSHFNWNSIFNYCTSHWFIRSVPHKDRWRASWFIKLITFQFQDRSVFRVFAL